MSLEDFEKQYPNFGTFLEKLFELGGHNEDLSEIILEEAMMNPDFSSNAEHIASQQLPDNLILSLILNILNELVSIGKIHYIYHAEHYAILNNIACFNSFF